MLLAQTLEVHGHVGVGSGEGSHLSAPRFRTADRSVEATVRVTLECKVKDLFGRELALDLALG